MAFKNPFWPLSGHNSQQHKISEKNRKQYSSNFCQISDIPSNKVEPKKLLVGQDDLRCFATILLQFVCNETFVFGEVFITTWSGDLKHFFF
jgi:hypothetical protein